MRDARQTTEYAKYMENLGWSVQKLNLESGIENLVYIKKLPLLGNIAKFQHPRGKLDPQKLDEFAKKYGLAALYIEPALNTRYLPAQAGKIPASTKASAGKQDTRYKIHNSSFLPSKTIQIDLTQSEKQLFNQLKKDTRYALRSAEKQEVVIRESKDIETFIKLWQQASRRRGMWLPQKKEILALWNAFGQKAHILFAYNSKFIIHNSEPIAGILLVRSPDTAYYMYAFSTKEGNRLSAPTLLVWEAIKLAKRKKCRIFDFEGIYDERYPQTKNWKGFTKFKEGFGGKIITYPQTLVRYYNPIVKFFV